MTQKTAKTRPIQQDRSPVLFYIIKPNDDSSYGDAAPYTLYHNVTQNS